MPQLTAIQLDDETVIYIETTEDVIIPPLSHEDLREEEEEGLIDKAGCPVDVQKQLVQSFQAIQGTIRAYTIYTLNAFKKIAIANVNKVNLEFGIEIGGEGGIPYITKGTAKSNLKITVECSFPERTEREVE